MSGNSINDFDFEYWAGLASRDPKKFEQLRQDKIATVIERARSPHQQHRLRGLQWRIDKIREQNKDSAKAACLAISELMWETFEHLAELLRAQAENGLSAPTTVPRQAKIIPFQAKSKAENQII